MSFLAKGRMPVLIHKLYNPAAVDWNNDPDDVRNLVDVVSRDWCSPLTWQYVNARDGECLRPDAGTDPLLQWT